MAYHHFPDKEAFEKEALRILKPGGLLYIADPNFPFPFRKAMNMLAQRFNGEFLSSDEISDRFGKYGFSTVSVSKHKYGQLVILQKT
jgi:SAM-dependent methyltransferase